MKLRQVFIDRSKSIESAISFSLFRHGVRILIPLLTYPIVYPILGPAEIGNINWALTLINILILVTSLGLDTSALKKISQLKFQRELVEKICEKVIIIKSIGFLISLVILALSLIIFPSSIKLLYTFLLLPILVSQIYGSEFLYTSYQLQKYTFQTLFLSNILFIALLVYWYYYNQTGIWYIMIYSICFSLGYFLNGYRIYEKFELVWYRIEELTVLIKKGVATFLINLSQSFFGKFDLILFGFILSEYNYGLLSSDYRIVMIGTVAISSIAIVILPKTIELLAKERDTFLSDVLYLNTFISLMISVMTILNADIIIEILFGEDFLKAAPILRILAPIQILIVIQNFFVWNVLYPNKKPYQIFWTTTPGILLVVTILLVFSNELNTETLIFISYTGILINLISALLLTNKEQLSKLNFNWLKPVFAVGIGLITIEFMQFLSGAIWRNLIFLGVFVLISFIVKDKVLIGLLKRRGIS